MTKNSFYLYSNNKINAEIEFRVRKVNELYVLLIIDDLVIRKADGNEILAISKEVFLGTYVDNIFTSPSLGRTKGYNRYLKNCQTFYKNRWYKVDPFDQYRTYRTKKENKMVGTIDWLLRHKIVPCQLAFNPISFDYLWLVLNQCVGLPLLGEMYVYVNAYHPLKPDPLGYMGERRSELTRKLGPIMGFFSSHYSGFVDQWLLAILSIRSPKPYALLSDYEKRQKENTNMHFFKSIFPVNYSHGEKGHPRLFPENGLTLSVQKRSIKREMCLLLSLYTSLHFYELDIKGCHLQVFLQCQGKSRAEEAELSKIGLGQDSFWDTLTDKFFDEEGLDGLVPRAPFRRAIKRSILALLNGSRVANRKFLIKELKHLVDYQGNLLLMYVSLLEEFLLNLQVCHLIRHITSRWADSGFVYPQGMASRYINQDKPHRVLTAVYSGTESLALSYAIQYFLTCVPSCVPVSLEGDGLLIMSNSVISPSKARAICSSIRSLILATVGFDFNLTFREV